MLSGTIVLSKISGIPGKLVWLGQAINGDLSEWTHAGIVGSKTASGWTRVFEARPGGAGWRLVSPEELAKSWVQVPVPLTDDQRRDIVAECYKRVGTDYNWTTYFYLAAYRLRLPISTNVLRRRVSRSDKMICSQAVDDIYRVCGVQLFSDGRLPYDVTPGDLDRLRSK